MNERDFLRWLSEHGPVVARENNERMEKIYDRNGTVVGEKKVIDSTTIVAKDGATLTLRRLLPEGAGDPGEGAEGPKLPEYEVLKETPPKEDKDRLPPARTPEQQRSDAATASLNEEKWNQEVRDNNERSWNQTAPGGSGKPETHAERAIREQKERDEQRKEEDRVRQSALDAQRQLDADADQRERSQQQAEANALARERLDLERGRDERDARKPTFLSQADTKSQYIVQWNNATGQMEQIANPNYDAVQVEAERKRADLELQIRQRSITLDEAKAQYTQWFDTNVKTPLMLAQEARAQAEEKRQALEAEERRRQFAADFGLRKAQLGETAASRATNAEISLLPYRAGPTEAAEMSSAINSLARGGRMDTDAAAGINFTPGAFQFKAPDFAKIARKAAEAAMSNLTDYRPSGDSYATADYSGVPAVNLSGAPAMPGAQPAYSLPEPSPGATDPVY
jgi:hypothetical protein